MKGYKAGSPNPIQSITKENLILFSIFKNYQNRNDLGILLKNNPTFNFEQFKSEADKINLAYNDFHLKTEYAFTKRCAEMESQWAGFIKDGVKYLQYVTKGDEKVRNTHAVLNGIIKPIDDEFWNTHTPPVLEGVIQYHCRCTLKAVKGDYPTNKLELVSNSKPNTNVGITHIIFPFDIHPYFQNVPEKVKVQLMGFTEKFNL